MVKVKTDLTGMVFGRLTVLKQVEDRVDKNNQHYAQYLCQCSCGKRTQVIVQASDLKKENGTRSCGCLAKERVYAAIKKYNEYDYSREYGVGYCHNTGTEFYFDWEDFDKIKDYCWSECVSPTTGYHMLKAKKPQSNNTIAMSHLLGFKHHDHINRNPLDNRKENFRPASPTENAQNRSKRKDNSSGITGVGWYKQTCKWLAHIRVNKKLINLGYFKDKNEAIVARLKAERQYFGEFAPQKHLFKEYNIIDNNE